MVSNLTIAMMIAELVLTLILPIVVIAYAVFKKKVQMKMVLVGAIAFIVSQLLIRVPLLNVLATQSGFQTWMGNPIFSGLFLGLTAGLVEEIARYLGFRSMRKNRTFLDGIGYGLGHGGIESIVLVGLATINNLIVAFAINNGTIQTMFAGYDSALIQQMIDILTTTDSMMFLLGGIERVMTLLIHVGLSLVVLQVFHKRNIKYLWYAIILHTLVNAPIALLNPYGILVTEAYIALCAAIALFYISQSARIE